MFDWLFGRRRENQYAALLAQSLATSRARFHSWAFNEETRTLNLETASLPQLAEALKDCQRCIAVEYPETEDGTIWAIERAAHIESAIRLRFPEEAKPTIDAVCRAAARAGRAAHGW